MSNLAYPAILDRTDLPAVFRSARCPRPNYAMTGKPLPERDLLRRIVQLAGEGVAKQIIKEFGGQTIHIRSAIASNAVLCRDCGNAVEGPPPHLYGIKRVDCLVKKISGFHPTSRRNCDDFLARPVASPES